MQYASTHIHTGLYACGFVYSTSFKTTSILYAYVLNTIANCIIHTGTHTHTRAEQPELKHTGAGKKLAMRKVCHKFQSALI